MSALTWAAGDTAAQRLWTRRLIALDSAGEGVPGARWNLLQATRDEAGIAAFLKGLESGPVQVPQMILFFGTLDSVTIANRDALLAASYRLAATKPERAQAAGDRVNYLLNLGRPDEAAKWIDTLATLDRNAAGLASVLGAYWLGGGPGDTTIMDEPDTRNSWRTWRGDAAAGQRLLASWRGLAAKDSTDGFPGRGAAILEAKLALDRNDPAAARLTDLADSLWVGRDGGSVWASFELARLYERQGRVDRALRAVRRRWIPMGEPEPAGLAESYRLEGKLAALADDRVGAIRAYRNYLKLRVDPEPSRVPQLDSVKAELSAVGDLEGKR
jgi:tetratricopeptide (TPR) repeat protein